MGDDMISLFTIPKPFDDPHIALIQRNALTSWKRLGCEIILLGTDEGVAEAAREFGVRHVPEVDYSEEGAPFVASVLRVGNEAASHRVRCHVNADIILLEDFIEAVESVKHFERFLVVGNRRDVDIFEEWDFDRRDIRVYAMECGRDHGPSGMAYFVHTPNLWQGEIPPDLALGRMFEDNYLMCLANKLRVETVDASGAILAVHQNHHYAHVERNIDREWEKLADCRRNREIVGQSKHFITSARWILDNEGLREK